MSGAAASAAHTEGATARAAPIGPLAMVVGYGAVGASAFVLLFAGPRLLGPQGHSALALTWTVVTIIGIGVAAPGEQTIARGLAAGDGGGIIIAVARRLVFVPIVAAVLLPLSITVLGSQIPDAAVWTSALVASAAAWVALACIRGVLAGRHRFVHYSASLLVEGIGRIGIVLFALVAAPDHGLLLLAAAIAAPLAASAAVGWLLLGGDVDVDVDVFAEDSRREQLAITAVALLGQVCLSTSPLWLQWQSADKAVAGAFVSATSYMRAPMLLAAGLYGPILTRAAQAFARGDRSGAIRNTFTGLAVGVGGSTALSILLFLASGPLMTLLYGSDPGLSDAVYVGLGIATVGSVGSAVLTQVQYGCERAVAAALAWIPPAVVTTLLLATAGGDVERMTWAMATGQVVASLALLALLPRALPSGPAEGSPGD